MGIRFFVHHHQAFYWQFTCFAALYCYWVVHCLCSTLVLTGIFKCFTIVLVKERYFTTVFSSITPAPPCPVPLYPALSRPTPTTHTRVRSGRGWDFNFNFITGMGVHTPSRPGFGTRWEITKYFGMGME